MGTTVSKPDVVKKMRAIRDTFSREIMNMTFKQEKEYIKKQLAKLKAKDTAGNKGKKNIGQTVV